MQNVLMPDSVSLTHILYICRLISCQTCHIFGLTRSSFVVFINHFRWVSLLCKKMKPTIDKIIYIFASDSCGIEVARNETYVPNLYALGPIIKIIHQRLAVDGHPPSTVPGPPTLHTFLEGPLGEKKLYSTSGLAIFSRFLS